MTKSSITVSACAEFLKTHDDFRIMSHRRPDGDTLGSSAGLCLILRAMGKTAYMMPNEDISSKYMDYVGDLFEPVGYAYKTMVSVDTAAESMFPFSYNGEEIDLSIDHHGSNTFFAKQSLVMPHKAACGEIIVDVAKALGVTPDARIADMLYIAITTDTGCFLYMNTTGDTHRAAADMMDCGADFGKINKVFFRTLSRARMKLESMIYDTIASYDGGKINIAVITLDMMKESGVTGDDNEDLAAVAGRVEGSLCSATIKQVDDSHCKVSLRTSGQVNASEVCALFGGGGHKMAAGCLMPFAPNEARDRLYEEIVKAWK